MTRREALGGLVTSTLAGGLALGGLPTLHGVLRAQTRSPTVFALVGDRYHNSDHYRTAFGKTLVRDMGVALDHPITRGVRDFTVTDEQHYMEYHKDPRYLLMQSVNEDGLTYLDLGTTAAAGWAYDYGKGRVCYLSPGHLITAMWNPEYEKLQRNAVRWLLREI